MRIARWMTKATNTHSEYVIFIAFPLQQWLHQRASMLGYMREERKPTRCNNIDDLLSIVDVDY